ncbi:MAG: hypothetical protein U0234_05580 [Sandaracinus sp.]
MSGALALAAIAGCAETRHCPEGESFRGGDCVALDAAVVQQDAAVVDVGTDASEDAGPCQGACGGSTRFCLESPDAGTNGTCVECLIDDDCDVAERPDAGSGDAGAPLSTRLICEGHRCVIGCRDGLADCSSHVCRSTDRQCSAYGTAQGQCQPCDTEENCDANSDCVPMTFGGEMTPIGSYCLLRIPGTGCPEPFTVPVNGHCGVNQAVTTCDAVRDFNTPCPTDPSECGRDDIPEDGTCATIVGLSGSRCTYRCAPSDGTCNSARPCGVSSMLCGAS